MNFYAHTAIGDDGQPLPESSGRLQPLAAHLANVAELARRFKGSLNFTHEANSAVFKHNLRKLIPLKLDFEA